MNMKLLKLPEPMKKTLETSAYTAGGMLLNRFIAPKLQAMFKITNPEAMLGIRTLSGLLLGSVSMQVVNRKDLSTALAVGALADVLVSAWNTYAPPQLRFAGPNMGLIIPMEESPRQQLPPGMPFSGLGYQVTEEVMPYAYN